MTNEQTNPVVETAKGRTVKGDDIRDGPYGVRYRLLAVAPGLIQESLAELQTPQPPLWHNPDKGRDEPNPNDPGYLRELEEHSQKQNSIGIDALCMFGIELEGPLPTDDRWIQKLKLMERRGNMDLSWVDWNSQVDLEFLFKRHVLGTAGIIRDIGKLTGVDESAINAAVERF